MTGNPHIKIAGVTGWPVHHSLSPFIHNIWLAKLGIKGAYTLFAVHPSDAPRAFKSLPHTTISGVNVTIPLKEIAYRAADILSPEAQDLGACNLLYTRDDKLIGHNTDMEGFLSPLLKHVGRKYILSHTVLVIGAGGAARAVLGALMSIGAPEIRLINRTDERAKNLVEQINIPSLYAVPWQERDNAIYGAGVVINASAGGMKNGPELDINLSYVMPDGYVYDLVYTPQNTPLLKQARKLGLQTIGGLEMLIAQARPSFHLLFGQDAPLDIGLQDLLGQKLKEQA